MTVIELHIPNDLEPALQQMPGDTETFILEAIRHELRRQSPVEPAEATDEDMEAATAIDQRDEWLSKDELAYYLNLPDVSAR